MEMAVKTTYFVHGTTTDNLEHKSTGWLPGELAEKGIEQSITLKTQVDINQFDIVFCSDLKRDQSTICVVEDVRDVFAMERTHEYKRCISYFTRFYFSDEWNWTR